MSRILLTLAGAATALLSFSSTAQADPQEVYDLAQGCYAIQSPHNDNFVRRYQSGGSVNSGWSFDFKANSAEQAAKFYFKPSGLETYMMRDEGGRYLDTRFPAEITGGNVVGKHANWRLDGRMHNGEHQVRFTSHALDRWLRHNWNSKGIYFVDLLNPSFKNSEEWFRLVPQEGCAEFPEAQLNVEGDRTVLKGNAELPVRGSIDAHTHITSYEFMGGTMMAAAPFHKFGVTKALEDSQREHGSWGSLDVIGNLMGFNDLNFRYDTAGWPDFPFWPNHKSLSHSGYYYKWIERAFLGGQRMMVTHLVENEVLCNIQSTLLPQSWRPTNSCNTMASVDLQINRLHEMQDYIDAQEGGPGKGFFRLVYSPEEARQVIADGKMAIVIGMEVSEPFNCGLKDATCSQAYIDKQLDKYYDLGVRALYPIHRFDNQFGGARIENGIINVGNNLSTGRYFSTHSCDDQTEGQWMTNDAPLFGLEGIIGVSGTTNYDETKSQCNNRGLTDLGIYLVNRMMDKGMIVEVDHMSQESHKAVLDIAEARQYSGLITGHSHMHAGENGSVHTETLRLAELGGFLATYNSDALGLENAIGRYLDKVEATEYLNGVGFSTDMSGIGNQSGPRSNADVDPLTYPFTTEFGFTIDKQVTGNRVFDLNQDGMAHYGFIADHIQDVRERSSNRIYESIMNSAEAYLQMWERAEANQNKDYVNPLEPFVRVFSRSGSKCLDVPGEDDNLNTGVSVGIYNCQPLARDQRWLFNKLDGSLSNQEAGGVYCLDNNSQPWNNGYPVLKHCNGSAQQSWAYSGQRITNAQSNNHSLDVYGNGKIGFWVSHNNVNQQWEMRLDTPSGQWAEYRNEASGQCLTANGSGQPLSIGQCTGNDSQLWKWNPTQGALISATNNQCASNNGATGNGTLMILGDCNNSQPFEQHVDSSLRLKNANQYALDAASNSAVLWQHHGNSNQRWHATLPQ